MAGALKLAACQQDSLQNTARATAPAPTSTAAPADAYGYPGPDSIRWADAHGNPNACGVANSGINPGACSRGLLSGGVQRTDSIGSL